ncbi:hypothetical protein [Brevibacterium casei]|uniref:hypothetical protein n=1 Tax=Brevibacterium casei TaxID=33889 RepID=UPI0036FF315F
MDATERTSVDESFVLIDERDITREAEADAFRVAHWTGHDDDPQDLTAVAVYESATATLDEAIEWAKTSQTPPARLTEVFAIINGQGKRKDSILIAHYDRRPPLPPGVEREPWYSESSLTLSS